MSEEIGIQGLTALSGEPPRDSSSPCSPKWDTNLSTLFIRRQNDPLEGVED